MADDHVARAEPFRHHLGREGFRAQRGKLGVEGDDESLVEAERLQQFELHRERRQPEERSFGGEEFAGMRLEHYGARAASLAFSNCDRLAENLLVAAMHAVEIADGKRGTLELLRHLPKEADNLHRGPSIPAYWRGVRRSTIITASPSSTVLPLTAQSHASVARALSVSRPVMRSVATTSSPI